MVEQEVFGSTLYFRQDPSSDHLGTTVWDASVVLAKWFEKNIRKGEFARSKVRGKKAIELGAGMGLAGMAFAMVGADVVLTDTVEVLDLLRINYETNLSPAAVRLARGHQHGTWADSAGSVEVAELDWTQVAQATAPPLHPPYDFVLAADCIYHETLTEHFHRTVMDITNDKSTVVVCNELRSHSVQGRFMELFTATHSIKSVPHSKMDEKYQHPNIFVYLMKKKKHSKAADKAAEEADGDGDALGCEDGVTGEGGSGAEASAQSQGQAGQAGEGSSAAEAGAAAAASGSPQAASSGTADAAGGGCSGSTQGGGSAGGDGKGSSVEPVGPSAAGGEGCSGAAAATGAAPCSGDSAPPRLGDVEQRSAGGGGGPC